jgi:hypothetical protein
MRQVILLGKWTNRNPDQLTAFRILTSTSRNTGSCSISWLDAAFPNLNWTALPNCRSLHAMKPSPNQLPATVVNGTRNALPGCLLLALGLFISACKPDAKVATATDATGVYTLVAVDGKQLPASVSHDGAALQVRSGRFAIKSDGTCSSHLVFVTPSGAESSREASAIYTQEGAKLSMQWKGAGKTTGTIEGNTFTMDNEGTVFAYRK